MPKVILSFKLPEEEEEFKLATQAKGMSFVLYELDQHLRAKVKYAPETQSEEKTETYQEIREKLWELAKDENVSWE